MKKKLSGVIPPIMAPVDKNENIDEKSLRKLVNRCIDGGVNGLFVLGTMGEGQSLVRSEKIRMTEITVDEAKGRVPVLAGVSAESHRKVLDNVQDALKAGADYLVALPPYFFSASEQSELVKFFKRIADASVKPVLIYNNPVMTTNFISMESFRELSMEENIIGVKNSSGNFEFHMSLVREFRDREDFSVFYGVETLCDAAVIMGSDGIVPGMGSLTPDLFAELYRNAASGDFEKAKQIQGKLCDIMNEVYLDGFWAWQVGQKFALSHLGVCQPYHSTETRALTENEKQRVVAALHKYHIH